MASAKTTLARCYGAGEAKAAQPALPGLALRVAQFPVMLARLLARHAAEEVLEGAIQIAQSFLGRALRDRIHPGHVSLLERVQFPVQLDGRWALASRTIGFLLLLQAPVVRPARRSRMLLTEKGQKAPRLQPGEAWPSPRAGVSPLCAKAAGAPCQRNRVGAFQLPWGTARADHGTACVLRAGCTTRRGFGPAPTPPTAAGLPRLVTGRGPPEQASAWLGRWTGRLRRPRTVERLSPEAASHCGGADQNLSASAGGVSGRLRHLHHPGRAVGAHTAARRSLRRAQQRSGDGPVGQVPRGRVGRDVRERSPGIGSRARGGALALADSASP